MKKIIAAVTIALFAFNAYAQHTMVLKTGEKLSGKVESLNAGVISFLSKGIVTKYKTGEVNVIVFGDEASNDNTTVSKAKEPGEKELVSGSYTIRYKIADRTIVDPPKVFNLTQKKGTVVVEVSIDKYGNVIKTVAGGEGSTTTDEYLFTKAKQAAESAKFDKVPNAPLEQKGYMIITF